MVATGDTPCNSTARLLHEASLALHLFPLRPYAAGSSLANTCCELFSSWNSLLGVVQAFGALHLADSDLEQVMSSVWVKTYPGMAGWNWFASYPFGKAVAFQLGCAAMGVRQAFDDCQVTPSRSTLIVERISCEPLSRSSCGCTNGPAPPSSAPRSIAGSPTRHGLPFGRAATERRMSPKPSISATLLP